MAARKYLKIRKRTLTRGLKLERLEDRSLLASLWQNPFGALDVDDSGDVLPLDALIVINDLNLLGSRDLGAPQPDSLPLNYVDVNGSGSVEPLDALLVINALTDPLALPAPVERLATNRFHVNVATGTVNILAPRPQDGSAGEVFLGSTVLFNSSQLLDQPGNAGRKILEVSLTNRTGETIGELPSGTANGLRVLFSPITNVGAFSDLRPRTTVSVFAGTGVGSSIDGPLASATVNHPYGAVADNEGNLYVTDYLGHKVRKISDGLVSTLAGSGIAGSVNGVGSAASFNNPRGIARNPVDGAIFVTELSGQRIRRITADGVVTTVAGTGSIGDTNGAGSVATFRNPNGLAIDSSGIIYVAESGGHRIRKIQLNPGANPSLASSYTVSFFAGGTATPGLIDGVGTAASFSGPMGVAVSADDVLFVADTGNQRIRRVTPTGQVVTIAGTGAAGSANGLGSVATFTSPHGIAAIGGGDSTTLLVADTGSQKIRQVSLLDGGSPSSSTSWRVQTLAGPNPGVNSTGLVNGRGDLARFNQPTGIAVDGSHNAYIADFNNNRIARLTPTNGFFAVGQATGSAPSEEVQLSNADGVIPLSNPVFGVIGSTGEMPFIHYAGSLESDQTSDSQAWSFIVPNGVTAFEFTVAVEADTQFLASPFGVSNPGPTTGGGSPLNNVRTVAGRGLAGFVDGDATEAKFNSANGIAVDRFGNRYVADTNNHSIRRVAPDGTVSTVAGVVGKGAGSADGVGTIASFNGPRGVAVTDDGQTLYVADSNSHTIRRIALTAAADPTQPSSWVVSTIAGFVGDGTYAEGPGGTARFNFPVGIAVTSSGIVYVSEFSGNRIRRLQNNGSNPSFNSSWITSLVAGSSVSPVGTAGTTDGFGTSARFDLPAHIAVDPAGNIYVADSNNNRIRKIDPDSNVSTLAGSTFGYHDDVGTAAQFGQPNGVAVDSAGYVWVSDTSFHRIRRISPTGVVTTVAGDGETFPGDLDGTGDVARFYFPLGIAVDEAGSLSIVSGGTYQFDGGGGVTSPGLRVRLIQRINTVGST